MRKILTIIMLMVAVAVSAQTFKRLRVYQNDGVVDTLTMTYGSTIAHSRLDLNGQQHPDYVSLIVTTNQLQHQYLLSAIDSLVLPNGHTVVFRGRTAGPPLLQEGAGGRLYSSFSGTFPGGSGVTYYWTENDHIRLDVGYESRAKNLTAGNTQADFLFEDADLDADAYTVYYPDKQVTILSHQTQTGANNTEHIGPSGDCGVATATRDDTPPLGGDGGGSYSFSLQHKAAYLCFLPHIDHLPSAKVTRIELYCEKPIAGTYSISKAGLYDGVNTSYTIALDLIPQQENDFFIGHDKMAEQDSVAAYMVIAPQNANRSFVATYYVTDTLSRISKVYHQPFSFQPVANKVYPITYNIQDEDFRTIDLGLSVRWSNVNVQSDTPNGMGRSFATVEEANAALTEASGVTDWLMPDADQTEEILNHCQWTWDTYNGQTGYIVTGASPSSDDGHVHRIFLPCESHITPAQCLAQHRRPVEALLIDLGLPSGVQWASRNVGAFSVTDYGDYYAWGETATKGNYTSDNYLYGSRNLGDDRNISGTQNDVAATTWGGLWRMPTKDDWAELKNEDHCTWEWQTLHGVSGYIITSQVNGNKIFLPASGVWRDGEIRHRGYGASYPSSIQAGNNSSLAWTLYFNHNKGTLDIANSNDYYAFNDDNTRCHRYVGRTVRPVATVGSSTDEIVYGVRTDSTDWHMGVATTRLYGTLTATKPMKQTVTVGFVVGDSTNITVDNALVLSQTKSVAGVFTDDISVYDNLGKYYRAYADVGDSIVYGVAKRYGFNLIDLELPTGTLWADMNLGANAPEEYGYYYAWGETEPKESYTIATYQYGIEENIGNNYDIAGSQYDAVHIQLGNAWRMPTKAQMEELLSSANCTWTRATRNSMNGYLVTSVRNHNTLFLPDAGMKEGNTVIGTNAGAAYQTSTHQGDGSRYFHALAWYEDHTYGDPAMRSGDNYYPFYNDGRATRRYWGHVIRPVYKPSAVTPDGLSIVILTDSAQWRMGDTAAQLHGTFTTSKHLDDGYRVGFVIGDSSTIVRGRAMREYELTVSDGCRFNTTQSVAGNIGYWYRSFVEVGGTTYYGEPKHFGIEMVDMGCSVKWANVNVGAQEPEEYGGYYAWGETTPKSVYSSSNYVFGTTQNLGNDYNISGSPIDAAAMNMGGGWRMPTYAEMQELLNSCNSPEWVLQNGVKGYRFTSKTTGNTLFFPSAGVINDGTLYGEGYGGSYLTSTQCSDGSNASYVMTFYYSHTHGGPSLRGNGDYYPFYHDGRGTYRYWGRSVRAVFDPNIVTATGDKLNFVTDSVHWRLGDTEAHLYATFNNVTPIDDGITIGIVAGDSITVERGAGLYQTELTVTGHRQLMLTVPVTDDFGYWYKPYVVVGDQVYYGDARHFGLEMIDLGLPSGLKWANMNVGASTPEDYGDYYAWGETSTKTTYTQDNYSYGTSLVNGGNITNNVNYDAAVRNMAGAYWRTPTRDEMQELLDNCTWSDWVLQNGVKGYRGVSKRNGKTIFLPAAGYYNGETLSHLGYGGTYMTANQYGEGNGSAHVMAYRYGYTYGSPGLRSANDYYPFYSEGAATIRWYGRSVRAVAVEQ